MNRSSRYPRSLGEGIQQPCVRLIGTLRPQRLSVHDVIGLLRARATYQSSLTSTSGRFRLFYSGTVQYVEVLTLLLVRLLQLDTLHRGILAKKICSGANVPLVFLVICGTIGVFAR